MANGKKKNESNRPGTEESVLQPEQKPRARVLLLGGAGRMQGGAPRIGAALAEEIGAHDLRAFALHDDDEQTAVWLMQNGADIAALAGMEGGRLDEVRAALGGTHAIGAGRTEALANAPAVLCVNDVRVGFLSYGERRAGGFDGRADVLGLMAYDQVRMLLNQCDHVIVFLRAGLPGARLPLPEWRARYRRLIDAGASVVADTGAAKGWEAHRNGLVFYGLGGPDADDSLAISLTLLQNGRLEYETRALEHTSGELRASTDEAFKREIDDQNRLYLDDAAYRSAVDEMCLRYYLEEERAQKRGALRAVLSKKSTEEDRLFRLLGDESRRLMTLRALRQRRRT